MADIWASKDAIGYKKGSYINVINKLTNEQESSKKVE